jgi:hypothetical protein
MFTIVATVFCQLIICSIDISIEIIIESLRISNKYRSPNSEQIPYEKCSYFEIT